jgi:hypothetical protein
MVTRRVLLQFQPSIRGRTRPVNGGDPCSGGDGAKDDGGRLVISAETQALTAVKGFPWRKRQRERKKLQDSRCKTEVGKSRILPVGQKAEVPSTAANNNRHVHFPQIGRRSLSDTSALPPF